MSKTIKERPILMSGPMVRAILDGSKTQTRRVVDFMKPTADAEYAQHVERHQEKSCKYGTAGDRLWVRETFHILDRGTERGGAVRTIVYTATGDEIQPTRPDHPIQAMKAPKAYPSIFMPRWASRITLEILSIRVERLQDIGEADAKAEGITRLKGYGPNGDSEAWGIEGMIVAVSARRAYEYLWEKINGPGSWDLNPWCWVIEFKLESAS